MTGLNVAVDVPDAACHWYVAAPDNTFGEGFDWAWMLLGLMLMVLKI